MRFHVFARALCTFAAALLLFAPALAGADDQLGIPAELPTSRSDVAALESRSEYLSQQYSEAERVAALAEAQLDNPRLTTTRERQACFLYLANQLYCAGHVLRYEREREGALFRAFHEPAWEWQFLMINAAARQNVVEQGKRFNVASIGARKAIELCRSIGGCFTDELEGLIQSVEGVNTEAERAFQSATAAVEGSWVARRLQELE